MNRFWSKVDQSGGPEVCWPWTAGLRSPGGYGSFRINGRTYNSHRIAYELTYGPIPEGVGPHGTVVRHKCANPQCCNPNHLELGTITDNNQDTVRHGRHVASYGDDHGLRKHPECTPRGEDAGGAVLTEKQVLEIRTNKDGISQSALGRRYGVSQGCIWHVIQRTTWKHL